MKRIASLLIAATSALLMQAGLSNSIEYTQLFIVGDATSAGWDLAAADEMPRIANGIFEWTGNLTAGKEFKFMNTREAYHKHIVCTVPDVTCELGKEYSLNFFCNWWLPSSQDFKFKVSKTGRYTVTVDLTSMRMKVSEPIEPAKWPTMLYMVGSATKDQVIQVVNCHGIELKKGVWLRKGNVKFIDTPTITENTKYYVPRLEDVEITYGQDYGVYLYEGDKDSAGWTVTLPGNYIVYLNLADRKMQCKKFVQYPHLFIAGGCTQRAWNYYEDPNNRFHPDPDKPEVMVWEGELRIGWDKKSDGFGGWKDPDEPSKFKIITNQDWNNASFHPYMADINVEGETNARITGGKDVKWTIKRNGFYRLELNTLTEVLKGTYLGTEANYIAPDSEAGIESVDLKDCPADYVYYNLQGIRVAEPTTGLYIASDGEKSFKLFIR